MALTKTVKDDKLEIVDIGDWKVLQVRTVTIVKEDDSELSRTFHRRVVNPTDDISSESTEIQALAAVIFTDEAKTAFQTFMDAQPAYED